MCVCIYCTKITRYVITIICTCIYWNNTVYSVFNNYTYGQCAYTMYHILFSDIVRGFFSSFEARPLTFPILCMKYPLWHSVKAACLFWYRLWFKAAKGLLIVLLTCLSCHSVTDLLCFLKCTLSTVKAACPSKCPSEGDAFYRFRSVKAAQLSL